MTKPYLLATPPYDGASGGIKVMYGLYGWLLAKGQAAFLNSEIDVPSVGIYPEIYHGNDMMASKVIRYILQTPGMMATPDPVTQEMKAGPTSFPSTDEIYVFSKVYDEWQSDDDHILFLPIIDLYNFRDLGKKRTKKAFYVGKGVNVGLHPKDAFELGRERDQEKLAAFLNECETLYIYDRLSALMECSRLCGCKVVYLGNMPKYQLELYEPGMNGLGYKEYVPLNSKMFRLHYIELIHTFNKKLDRFIDHTQR